ncbi:P-type conjugative transfer protein TrbL [Brevundimonas sp. SORGH_AS_0993]|uniref:P-type conjugative transfer protein TrbL n=1 Tax=Brevundimonas sp. SORGH_AS_0993 TaxID=3041794 RepID=UPI002785A49B|nr:P-type conjugative transfer protein TrbL [Brevundimonas sp. SORGH_AS_0993]MDQ1153457.1 type IV secretion system protein TrbL [Brevundimonas sp. SORGH_AS_0993]
MDPAPDLNIIDRFMAAFVAYIDSGFGLLGGDVAFLTTVLIGIDVTLAALWWAMDADRDILGRFLKKILYVGAFAFIISNFQRLGDIVYRSFAGLGITAGGGGLSADDLLKPGKLASVGFEAAHPLIKAIEDMLGFPEVFGNLLSVLILLIAWLLVVLAFFVLAIQLFICVIEFKLTTLAGFVLVPFALWNKTSFLAERVLGNVVSSGLKVMVLAVIVGIGSGFFESFIAAGDGEPDVASAMTLVLGALTLLGLGVFGPGIATGLISGAPQLGAGAAVGTVAGAAIMGAGGVALGARALGAAASGGMAAMRAGTAMGSAAQASYQLGAATSGASGAGGVAAGLGGVARAAGGAAIQGARGMASRASASFRDSVQRGRDAAWTATGGAPRGGAGGGEPPSGGAGSGDGGPAPTGGPSGSPTGGAPGGVPSGAAPAPEGPPAWARKMHAEQTARHRRQMLIHTVKDGDRGGVAANPSLKED